MASSKVPYRSYRTIFVSDLHLGSKPAQAEAFMAFLGATDCEALYLVGDMVDGWRLKRVWYWPQTHNDVVQKILRKARKGTRVVYLPGNHDEFLKPFEGEHFGGVVVSRSAVHETVDGRRLLVVHGDEMDIVVRHARLIAYLGDWAYDAAIAVNRVLNDVRRRLGLRYWSLSSWAKLKVKGAVNVIGDFEGALRSEARRHGCDGVVCGHIHHAALEIAPDFVYANSGDWVESRTALVEHHDGRLELLRWDDMVEEGIAAEDEGDGPVRSARPDLRLVAGA